MKELEQRILKDGKLLGNDILKVGSFLNQQVDTDLLVKMAKEVKRLFPDEITKVLTIDYVPYDRDLYRTEYIGIDENNKFVKREITASEVKVAIVNLYDKIFELIQDVMKSLPKDILADIYNNGIMFVGGANKIAGMYEYARQKLDLPIIVPEDPQDAVILGAGKLLNSGNEFLKIDL